MSVCLSVCLFVCPFTFEVPFNGFFAPLPEVGCKIFLEIRNPWGKVMERSGLIFEHFCLKIVKNCRAKKSFFLLILRPASVRRLYWDMRRLYWYDAVILRLVLDDFFRYSKKSCFGVFLVHPPMASVLLSASVERFSVSRMRDFYEETWKNIVYLEYFLLILASIFFGLRVIFFSSQKWTV
jgi:hypothetical protein